jgi:ketosteroid isomerase-like protein
MRVRSSNQGGAMSTIITEHANAALVRRGYEALNEADIDTLTEIVDETASWHTPARSSIVGDHRVAVPNRAGSLAVS